MTVCSETCDSCRIVRDSYIPLCKPHAVVTHSFKTVSNSYLISVRFEAVYKYVLGSLWRFVMCTDIICIIYIVYESSKPHLGARDIWKPWVFPKSNWMGKNPACFQLGLSLSVFSSCLAHREVKPRGLLGWEPQCLDVFKWKIKLSGSSRRKFQLNKDLCFTETKKWCELPQARRQLGAWLTIRT